MAAPKVTVIIPAFNAEDTITTALASIPKRKDIEIIVVDDGSDSTDETFEKAITFRNNLENEFNSISVISFAQNKGVAAAVNKGLDTAKGEYITLLGSDDYFYSETFERVMDSFLNGEDLCFYKLETNDCEIITPTPQNHEKYCGSLKFMRREFIGDTRNDETKKAGEDYYFMLELMGKMPTETYCNEVVKHYNYPREGSLSDKRNKGLI